MVCLDQVKQLLSRLRGIDNPCNAGSMASVGIDTTDAPVIPAVALLTAPGVRVAAGVAGRIRTGGP